MFHRLSWWSSRSRAFTGIANEFLCRVAGVSASRFQYRYTIISEHISAPPAFDLILSTQRTITSSAGKTPWVRPSQKRQVTRSMFTSQVVFGCFSYRLAAHTQTRGLGRVRRGEDEMDRGKVSVAQQSPPVLTREGARAIYQFQRVSSQQPKCLS